jgi:hypothetical protein
MSLINDLCQTDEGIKKLDPQNKQKNVKNSVRANSGVPFPSNANSMRHTYLGVNILVRIIYVSQMTRI